MEEDTFIGLESFKHLKTIEDLDVGQLRILLTYVKEQKKLKSKRGRPVRIKNIDDSTDFPVETFRKLGKITEEKTTKFNYHIFKDKTFVVSLNTRADCMHYILDNYNTNFNYQDICSMNRSFYNEKENITRRNNMKYNNFKIQKIQKI